MAGLQIHGGHGSLSAGTIVAFTTLQARLLQPIIQLLQVSVDVQSSVALFGRVFEYLDLRPEITDRPRALGHIVESGSHDPLIAHRGPYARRYEEQFGSGAVQAFCSDGIVLADGRCVAPATTSPAAHPRAPLPVNGAGTGAGRVHFG